MKQLLLALALALLAVTANAQGEYKNHEDWPDWGECETIKLNEKDIARFRWHLHDIIKYSHGILGNTYMGDAVPIGPNPFYAEDSIRNDLADMQIKIGFLRDQICGFE